MNFGTTSLAAPQAASSSVSRYSRTERRATASSCQSTSSVLAKERCLLASAAIKLASTAKPSPPAKPSVIARCTTISNRRRKASLSRKRPWRVLEKVEWSGTRPSNPSRQRWSRRATTPGRVSPDVCPQTFQEGIMDYFAGLDVSLETVSICIVNAAGDILLEKKIEAEPAAIIALLKHFGRPFKRIGLEAGPTSSWLYSELRCVGYPAICLECRHVKAGLSAMRNKTDRNDARGIAQLVRLGWFRQVHVKSKGAQQIRMLLVNRQQLLTKALDLENSVRGSLKVFGLRIGTVTRRTFEARVLELVAEDRSLIAITEPMLRVRRALLGEFERLDRLCRQVARRDPVCHRLMTVPGVGTVVALTYRTGIDAPERFSRSRDVGAHFGLTPRRYSSGQTDYDGHI